MPPWLDHHPLTIIFLKKHVRDKCDHVLFIHSPVHPEPLHGLSASSMAPAGADTEMYTYVNQDHMQLVNACQSLINSSLVMTTFVMLLCFVLTAKKEQEDSFYEFSLGATKMTLHILQELKSSVRSYEYITLVMAEEA